MALSFDLPGLRKLCSHGGHPRQRVDTKSLARWPWGVMKLLAVQLKTLLQTRAPRVQQQSDPAIPPQLQPATALPLHPDL
eukprot:4935377-Amphidinium_carterae.1